MIISPAVPHTEASNLKINIIWFEISYVFN